MVAMTGPALAIEVLTGTTAPLFSVYLSQLLWSIFTGAATVFLARIVQKYFICPADLSHLPRVSISSLFLSFIHGETEDIRVRRLILPFSQRGEGIVVVWALGGWYVHILKHELGIALMQNRSIQKEQPRTEMLFWRLTGTQNVFFHEGDAWMRHSSAVRAALHRNVPIETFNTLSYKLFSLMGSGGKIQWDAYTHRFTVDAIGAAVLGYDFEALEKPHGSFVQQYREVVGDISNPLYVSFPGLERYIPRTRLLSRVMQFRNRFQEVLALKRQNPGNDLTSYMVERSDMSGAELLDNMVAIFMAGHDTTAGALSTLIYYLARYQHIQDRARAEVLSVLGAHRDPTIVDFDSMPFSYACIKESMRLNGPSTITIPRVSSTPISVGPYTIPANTPIALNLYAVLHDEQAWPTAERFNPDRFMSDNLVGHASWLPFGAGPRRCPASSFALYEQRTLIALLLRNYEWSLPNDTVHVERPVNAFSTFALNLPKEMFIMFSRIV